MLLRVMRNPFLIALCAGIASAVLYLSFFTNLAFGVLLIQFAPLPLFLAGLGLGLQPMLIATGAAVGAITMLGLGTALPSQVAVQLILFYLLGQAVMPLWLTRMALMSRSIMISNTGPDKDKDKAEASDGTADNLRAKPQVAGVIQYYPIGQLVAWITGIAAVLLLLAAVFGENFAADQGGLRGIIGQQIGVAVSALGAANTGAAGANVGDELNRAMAIIEDKIPAILALSWIAGTLVNLWLAQTILVRLKYNRRPAPNYTQITLPETMLLGLLVALAIFLFPVNLFMSADAVSPAIQSTDIRYIGMNLTMIMLFPYFLLGLAVIHVMSRPWPARKYILGAVYLALPIVGLAAAIFAVVGVVEQWVGLRERMPRNADNQEEE